MTRLHPAVILLLLAASTVSLTAEAGGGPGLFGLGYGNQARGGTLDGYTFPKTNTLVFAGYLLPAEREGLGITASWMVSDVAARTLDRPVVISDLQYNYSIFNLGVVYRPSRRIFLSGGVGYSFENAERSINAQKDLEYTTYETKQKHNQLNLFGGIGWITTAERCPVGLALQYDSAPRAFNVQLLLGCGFA